MVKQIIILIAACIATVGVCMEQASFDELKADLTKLKQELGNLNVVDARAGIDVDGEGLSLHVRLVDQDALKVISNYPVTFLVIDKSPAIASLSSISGMCLQELAFFHTQVDHLSDLTNLPLVSLHFEGKQICDMEPLGKIRTLKHLYASNTGVTSTKVLTQLNLSSLSLAWTKIDDFSPLTECPLVSLNIAGTKVNNLDFTKKMPLISLNASYTNIKDLTPLLGMQCLENLNLSYTKIDDISALKGMKLKRLDISGTAVTNISYIQGMPLESLQIRRTNITDLKFLEGSDLHYLAVDKNFPTNGLPHFEDKNVIVIGDR